MDMNMIEWLENKVQGALRPDLTILLDAPVAIGMDRANKRGKLDRFESEQQTFFENVRAAYLKRAQQKPDRIRIINADQSLDRVKNEIGFEIQQLLSKR
jgi:dTMP kinase